MPKTKNHSLEERALLARTTINLLDQWGIGSEDQIKILALPSETRTRTLRRYRDNTPFPDDTAVMERVEFLLAIAEALRTAFPTNQHMGAQWMNRPHRRFRKRTPVATIIEDGMLGLISVRAELDCTYSWDLTGSRP